MSCPVAGRGHRRSWSWPGTVPRTCCAGSSTSGTDPGTPGCPGSSPPGIRSGTATAWSASAPVRCGPWRTRARTRGCRAGCSGVTGRSVRGPRPHPAHQALTIPGTGPGTITGPEAASDASRPSSGMPDTGGVPVKACGGPVPDSRASRRTVRPAGSPWPDFTAGNTSASADSVRPLAEPGRRVEAVCLQTGSACQAGEPCRRVPAAVRASRRELRWGDAEDGGQPLNLLSGESLLPAVATPFSGAHGGVTSPAHQFAGLCLIPAVSLAKDSDVRAGNGGLIFRDLIDAAAPSPRYAPACQVTLYDLKVPGRLRYRLAASIASAP